MGMVTAFASVSDANIQRLLADPPLVWQVIAPADPEAYERARQVEAARAKPGFVSRLFDAKAAPPPPPPNPITLGEAEAQASNIDKSWHGIHFLLTGRADEAGTKDIAAALAALSDDELRRRYAPDAMMKAEIYPEIWDRTAPNGDLLSYLMEYVNVIREMLATVTARGHGLLVYLC